MGFISNLWVKLGLKDDDFVKGLNRATSKTTSFSNQAGKAIGELAARFASLTAIVGVFVKTISDGVKEIASFERKTSELAAVLGKSKTEISGLSKAGRQLAKDTEFTASQVTDLQIALARLGFDDKQIIDMQEAVVKFATAVGTDAASAADFTGAALRAFGLTSKDTTALLDTMAAATVNSALDFSKLSTAIGIVAPIAHTFGLTAADTAALVGQLANAGIDASTAATSLRNILIKLAQPGSKIYNLIKDQVHDLPSLLAALKELKDDGVDLGSIAENVDARALAAFTTLLDGSDSVAELSKKLSTCNGQLNTMYDQISDNLIGSVRKLTSAWSELVLKFEGTSGPLKNIVDHLTDIVNRMGDILDGDKITAWEAIFGPIVGGAIAGGRKRGNDSSASDFSAYGGGSGGGVRGEAGVVTPEAASTGSGGKSTTNQLKADLQKIHEEQEALNAEMREYDALWEKAADDFHKYSDLPPIKPFDNDYIATAARNFKQVTDELDKADAEAKQLQEDIDAAFNEAFDKLTKGSFEVGDLISGVLTAAVQGFSDCVQELANSLMQVGELDSSALTKALLDPLCDMAKQMGEVMMTMAAGMIAVKTSIDNPYLLLAAGAALVAIGAAGKAALASITAGGSTSSAAGTTTTSAGSTTAENMEMTIHIEGKLKGSDIVLAGQRTQMAWGR